MTVKKFSIFLALSILSIAALSTFLESCQPTCDSIPTEALAQVRIVDAISNASAVTIYVDGKLFDSAFYTISGVTYPFPRHSFGYRSTYLSDGSELRAGLHHVVAKARVMWQDSLSSIVDTELELFGTRQSLIYIGKIGALPEQTPRVLYLKDLLREAIDTVSYARFIHAVPDISGDTGSLDVYFDNVPRVVNGVPRPDIHIRYGHISHTPNGDNGTGLSPDDYIQFPHTVPGLVVMPGGDTDINNAIVNIPYSAITNGLLATIVVRGEMHPNGSEPAASALVVEDGDLAPGVPVYDEQTLGVRTVNAARYDSLSLLISSSQDAIPGTPRSPGHNNAFPEQQKVTNLATDSVSAYLGLGWSYSPPVYIDFWFGPTDQDTAFRFRLLGPQANERFTFIAIDTIPHNTTGKPGLDSIVLSDTVSAPADPSMGRVRIVSTSADYTASFTLNGTNFSMKQRDVRYIDVPVGAQSFTASDGNSGTERVNFALTNAQPITIFFLPSDAQHSIPYTVSAP